MMSIYHLLKQSLRIPDVVFAPISMDVQCSLWDLILKRREEFDDDVGTEYFIYATRMLAEKKSERPIEVAIPAIASYLESDVAELQIAAAWTIWGICQNKPIWFEKCDVKLYILRLRHEIEDAGFGVKKWLQIAMIALLKIFGEESAVDLCRTEIMESVAEFALQKVGEEYCVVLDLVKDLFDAAERLNLADDVGEAFVECGGLDNLKDVLEGIDPADPAVNDIGRKLQYLVERLERAPPDAGAAS
jgi:hypothetical protein